MSDEKRPEDEDEREPVRRMVREPDRIVQVDDPDDPEEPDPSEAEE